jgi:hypothetical protein
VPLVPDPVAQTWAGSASAPALTGSFEGISSTGWMPPDTNGDVGPNHYIQTVNSSIQIFSKDGSTPSGPTTFNTLFASAPAPCNSANTGDPIVMYDHVADRWLITDMAWASTFGPFYQCIAVSKTSDPVLGGWWLYTMKAHDTWSNDYPKLGIWGDGFYMTANMWQVGAPDTLKGTRVWALNRAELPSRHWISWTTG